MLPIKCISDENRAHPIGTLNWHSDQRAWRFGPPAPAGGEGRWNSVGSVDLTSPKTDRIFVNVPTSTGFKVKSSNRASEPIHGGLS